MRFISIRDLRSKSVQIQRDLPMEKEMIITSNGKPIAILSSTSADRVEESLSMLRQMRSMEAAACMQRRSVKIGTDKITLEEINKEIVAVRKSLRKK
ncbi:MAG: type II toxin-antitoxin system Phd/YefM family antitoxin [Candidatus Omnitrophota bacterium]